MNYRVIVSHEAEKISTGSIAPPSDASGHGSLNLPKIPSIHVSRRRSPHARACGRSRVGGWRILFTLDRVAGVIYIATVDTRGQAYKHS